MTNWTREQTLIALHMYCYTRYGRINKGNKDIIRVAELLGRTPSALAMKMLNLASMDRQHLERGVVSMANTSRLDRQIWQEFEADRGAIIYRNEGLMARLLADNDRKHQDYLEEESVSVDVDPLREGWETGRLRPMRGNQSIFRRLILSIYGDSCCITGIAIPELLIASHIMPWASHPNQRLDPRNGLCLNALHDRAFDRGLYPWMPTIG